MFVPALLIRNELSALKIPCPVTWTKKWVAYKCVLTTKEKEDTPKPLVVRELESRATLTLLLIEKRHA